LHAGYSFPYPRLERGFGFSNVLEWRVIGFLNTTRITEPSCLLKQECSKKAFYLLDRILFRNLWNWARRMHNNLGYQKIVSLYFKTIGNRRWVFFGKFSGGLHIHLRSFGYVKIRRHRLIRGEAHPYDPKWFDYLAKRKGKSMQSFF
jgi:hypothetical protein